MKSEVLCTLLETMPEELYVTMNGILGVEYAVALRWRR